MKGKAPRHPLEVDHKDRNGENNSWDNLRQATKSVNINNRRKLRSSSGETFIGPTANGRWRVRIRGISYGTYATLADAKRARDTMYSRV